MPIPTHLGEAPADEPNTDKPTYPKKKKFFKKKPKAST